MRCGPVGHYFKNLAYIYYILCNVLFLFYIQFRSGLIEEQEKESSIISLLSQQVKYLKMCEGNVLLVDV
mgnify:CR=1 FL=1